MAPIVFCKHPVLLQVISDKDEGPPKHIIPWIRGRAQADAQSVWGLGLKV